MALFESYERRIDKITSVLNSYGIASIEEAEKITKDAGLDVYAMVKGNFPLMPKQMRCQRHRCSRRKRKKLLLCPA